MLPWKKIARVYWHSYRRLHDKLDELGIPGSYYGFQNTKDGAYVRLETYVNQVKATVGEIDAVPREQFERVAKMRDDYQKAYWELKYGKPVGKLKWLFRSRD